MGSAPSSLLAQEQGISVERIELLLGARQTSATILQLIQTNNFCLSFVLDDQATARLRAAGADDDLITGLGDVAVCGEVERAEEVEPPPPPEREVRTPAGTTQYSPGSAALRSLAIPGLGQFYTGNSVAGGLFLASWAGALGFGLMSQEVTVYCLEKTTESCPSGRVRDSVTERPMMMVGVGAAAAIAIASALHARSAANKANAPGFGSENDAKPASPTLHILPADHPLGTRDVVLVQLRF